MPPAVQLLLPGLFDLPLEELDARLLRDGLPCLNYLLSRSVTRDNADYSLDAMLSSVLFDQSGASSASLPMAAAFAPDAQTAERCLLLEAVHLQADLQGAIAIPISKSEENLHDIELIISDLRDLFKVDCDITAVADGRYLLQLHDFDAPVHYPHPLSVLGKSITPYIEQSRQVLPWYRLVNEFQMFMHQHPVNERRLQQGRLAINSLWAWGAGVLPQPARRPDWFCDDELLNRFAASLGLPVASCASLGDGQPAGHAVIVDLRLLQLLKSGSDARLDELLLDIERNLIEPLLRPGARSLTLRAAYRVDFELGSRAGLKFWRRSSNLQDWR